MERELFEGLWWLWLAAGFALAWACKRRRVRLVPCERPPRYFLVRDTPGQQAPGILPPLLTAAEADVLRRTNGRHRMRVVR